MEPSIAFPWSPSMDPPPSMVPMVSTEGRLSPKGRKWAQRAKRLFRLTRTHGRRFSRICPRWEGIQVPGPNFNICEIQICTKWINLMQLNGPKSHLNISCKFCNHLDQNGIVVPIDVHHSFPSFQISNYSELPNYQSYPIIIIVSELYPWISDNWTILIRILQSNSQSNGADLCSSRWQLSEAGPK